MNYSRFPSLAYQRKTITEESVKKEMNRRSKQISLSHNQQKNSMKNTRYSPCKSATIDRSEDKLRRVGLSEGALCGLLCMFSSKAGETRAVILGNLIYFLAGIPARFEDEISLLANLLSIPRNPTTYSTPNIVENLSDFVLDCLLLETCYFKLEMIFGEDWYERIAPSTWNPSAVNIMHSELSEMRRDCTPHLILVRFEMMDLLMEHESRETVKLVWIEHKMKHKLKQLSETTRKLQDEVNRRKLQDEANRLHQNNADNRNGRGPWRMSHDNDNLIDSTSHFDRCNNNTARNGRPSDERTLESENPTNAVRACKNTQLAFAPNNLEMTMMQQDCVQHPSIRYSDLTRQEKVYYDATFPKRKKTR